MSAPAVLSTPGASAAGIAQLDVLATPPRRKLGEWLMLTAMALVFAWAWQGAEMRPLDLWRDAGNMATYGREFFPPDFSDWRLYLKEMVVTQKSGGKNSLP